MIDQELLNLFDFKVNQLQQSLIQEIFFIIRRILLSLEKETIIYEHELTKRIIQPETIDEEDDMFVYNNETEIELDQSTLQKYIGELGEMGFTEEIFHFDSPSNKHKKQLETKPNHFDMLLKNQQNRIIEDIKEEKKNKQSIYSINHSQHYDNEMIDELLNSFDAIQISRDTERYDSKAMESSSTVMNDDSEFSESLSDSDLDCHNSINEKPWSYIKAKLSNNCEEKLNQTKKDQQDKDNPFLSENNFDELTEDQGLGEIRDHLREAFGAAREPGFHN